MSLSIKKEIFIFSVFTSLFLVFNSCTKDNSEIPHETASVYSQGIFIINEGPFQTGTGTITYFNRDGSNRIEKLYQNTNNLLPLGNIVQSMNVDILNSNKAFITVNNANIIEVVDLKTFKNIGTIENITNPRYVGFGMDSKAYISCWDNTVKVVDVSTYSIIKEIIVGTGPEKMKLIGSNLWVLNQGGYSVDSVVSIIDTDTEEVVKTIQVYSKPSGIQLDENNNVWIICSGKGWNGFPGEGDTEGHLLCISTETFEIIKDFAFSTTFEHPEKLVINSDGDRLYYNYIDGIYSLNINDTALNTNPFIARTFPFYGLGFDLLTNTIYASDPLDFAQDGIVYRYDGTTGIIKDSLKAGIGPGEFYFTK